MQSTVTTRGTLVSPRQLHVHLTPSAVGPGELASGVAVVVDVLRATTSMVHALAAGAVSVRPVTSIDEARSVADELRAGEMRKILLAGERGGKPIDGFELGNSPREFTATRCRGRTVVMTTTNGTGALVRAADSHRVIVGAFVNFSAVCEWLRGTEEPMNVVCAGSGGAASLEDTLFAGALVDVFCDVCELELNDGGRLAWDCFENHGLVLRDSLGLSDAGKLLTAMGYQSDLDAAAAIDKFAIVPELRRDPLRLEVGSVGVLRSHWKV
jgi:2-phosphosulfolactate phosphatase